MAERNSDNTGQQRVAPSTVYKVEGSPDDYRYILRGADLVLIDKNEQEHVFMFVGNIMSLDGKVNMQFTSGESLEAQDLFNRSEMPEVEQEEESSEWQVQLDESPPPADTEGNSSDGTGLLPPDTSMAEVLAAQAALAYDPTQDILDTQRELLRQISAGNDGDGSKADNRVENKANDNAEEKPEKSEKPEEPVVDPVDEPTLNGEGSSESKPVISPDDIKKPTIELADSSDTGASSTDNITKESDPEFIGTADAGATVQIYVDNVLQDTVTANGDGKFSTTGVSGFLHGEYDVRAVAVFDGGVTSDSDTMRLTVDLVAPELPTIELSSLSNTTTGEVDPGFVYTKDNTPTLQGINGDPGSTVSISYWKGGVLTEMGKATVVSDGSWGFKVPAEHTLAEGTYRFQITATDLAGNVSTDLPVLLDNVVVKNTFTPDTSITLDADSNSMDADAGGTVDDTITKNETIKLNISTSADARKVEIFYESDDLGIDSVSLGFAEKVAGKWVFSVAADKIDTDGNYTFRAAVTDMAGNSVGRYAHKELDIEIDRTAPIENPAIDLADSSDTSGELIGTDSDDYTSGEDNGSGGKMLVLNGSDAGGNVWVDLYVTGNDGHEDFVAKVQADASGNWTYNYDSTDNGKIGSSGREELEFRAEISDAAGNVKSGTFDVEVDQKAPTIPSIEILDRDGDEPKVTAGGTVVTVRNADATLTGRVDEGADDIVVTIFDSDKNVIANSVATDLGGVTINDDGTWTYNYGALTDGDSISFYVRAEDKAGNKSEYSDKFTIESDQSITAPILNLHDSTNTAGGPSGSNTDDYTGYVDGDKDNPVKLYISGDEDSTVKVYLTQSVVDGVTVNSRILVGTYVQNPDGTWPEAVFDASAYAGKTANLTFEAVATDPAHNTETTTYSMVLDDTYPVGSDIDLAAADDFGTLDSDEITNAKEILLTGTLEEGADAVKVIILDNGTEIGVATVSSDGTGGYKWEYTIGDESSADAAQYIAEGNHSYTAILEDNAGNRTSLAALPVIIDRSIAAPTFELTSGAGSSDTGRITDDGITNAPDLVFNGSSDINDTIIIYKTDEHGVEVEVGKFVATAENWSYSIGSSGNTGTGITIVEDADSSVINDDGSFTFHAVTSDVAGNTKTTADVNVTIDRSTNTPGAIDLASESDSFYLDDAFTGGTTDADNITSKGDLTFTGDVEADGVEAGSTVYLYIEGVDSPVGSVVLGDGDTSWSITVPEADASEGTHNFYVKYVDLAGNESVGSADLQVDIDRSAPDTPTVAMAGDENTDFFVKDGNVYTKEIDPTFTIGNLEADTVLNIKMDGVSVATPTVGGSTLTFNPDDFAADHSDDGMHTITVVAVDSAGNASAEQTYTFYLDTQADPITGLSLTDSSDSDDAGTLGNNQDDYTNDPRPEIEGRAEPGSAVTVSVVDSSGTVVLTSEVLTAASDGTWTYSIPDTADALVDGTYTVKVEAVDYAGNKAVYPAEGSGDSYPFIIDTAVEDTSFALAANDPADDPVNDSGFSSIDGYTANTRPEFFWDAKEDLTVTIKIYKSGTDEIVREYSVDPDDTNYGSWSVPDALEDGSYTVKASFEDKAGNVRTLNADGTEYSIDLTVDTEAPVLSVDLADDSDSGLDGDWLISGEVLDNGSGEFNTLEISGDDATVVSKTVTDPGLKLTGSTEAGNRIYVKVNGTSVSVGADGTDDYGNYFQVDESGDGSWDIDLSSYIIGTGLNPYIDGISTNTVKVVALDKAGNVTEFDKVLIVDQAVEAGTILLSQDDDSDTGAIGDFITSDTTPTLTGNTEGGAVVQLFLVAADGTKTFVKTDIADSDGKWAIAVPESTFPMSDGKVVARDYNFRIEVTDTAGNTDSTEQNVKISFAPKEPAIVMDVDSAGEFFGTTDDFITDDTDPEFTVTVESNTSLIIYRTDESGNRVKVFEQAASGDTEHVYQHGTLADGTSEGVLAEGTYTYEFESTDANGMSTIHTQTVKVDPAYDASDLTLAIHEDSNSGDMAYDDFNADGTADIILTNVKVPLLTGTAEAGSLTRMFVSSVYATEAESQSSTYDVDSAVAVSLGADGNWSPSPTLLGGDGYYKVTIISEDEAGNQQTESIIINLDTTDPVAPTFNVTTDAGDLITGDDLNTITDLTPRFEGKADPDPNVSTTVTIKSLDGANGLTFDPVLDAEGNWVYQVGDGTHEWLKGGEYTVEVSSTDRAGNESSVTGGFTILQDTGAEPTVGLLNTDDTNIDTDGITSLSNELQPDGELSLTGTAIAFGDVEIYRENSSGDFEVVATVAAGENGRWSWAIPGTPADGDYVYRVKSVSNGKDSTEFTLTVDSENTSVDAVSLLDDTGIDGADWLTSNPTITGVVEKGSTVEIIATDVTDPSSIRKISIPSEDLELVDGKWVYEDSNLSTLSDGEYSIKVVTTDKAGNVITIDAPHTLKIDTTLDKDTTIRLADGDDSMLKIVNGKILDDNDIAVAEASDLPADFESTITDNITDDRDLVLTGTAEVGATIVITITKDEEPYLTDSFKVTEADGSWSYDPAGSLGDGKYTATIKATDEAGVTSEEKHQSFEVDSTPSTAAVIDLYDDDDIYTKDVTPTLTLRGDDDSTYLLYHKYESTADYSLVDTGTFSSSTASYTVGGGSSPTPADLIEGAHTYKLVTVDQAGNVQTQEYTIHVDLTPPAQGSVKVNTTSGSFSLTADNYLYTDNDETVLTVTVADRTSYVILTEEDGTTRRVDVVGTTATFNLHIDSTTVNDGQYDYKLAFYDAVDNHDSNQDLSFKLVVDSENPYADIKINADSDRGFNDEPEGTILTSGDKLVFNGKLSMHEGGISSAEFATQITYVVTVKNSTTNREWNYFSDDPENSSGNMTVHDNGDGTYEFTFGEDGVGIADGHYTATIVATDMAGNMSTDTVENVAESTIAFDVDNNSLHTPELTVEAIANTGMSLITGTYDIESDLTAEDYKVDLVFHDNETDTSVTRTANMSADGKIDGLVTSDLSDHDYVEVKVSDKAGNEAESQFIDLDSSDLNYTADLDTGVDLSEVTKVSATLSYDSDSDGTYDTVIHNVVGNVTGGSWRMDFGSSLGEGDYKLNFEGLDSSSTVLTSNDTAEFKFSIDDMDTGDASDDIFTSAADSEQDFNGADEGNGGAGDESAANGHVVEAEVHIDHIDFNIA
ncbi:Ig-like domain-containing protein [Maridesulfovibrio hydrothermalis]|uniref:Bacterial Ig-like domain-containing protein n=1 Tax=Maridesulfovibrio hydrothermalis AM13 = DSM 14728 TaxID=1121451 RepID=L0RD40_9BACT|nr:Ig-like domain-containing protein [Maridesulfovibrio hydrothermalis]CCO24142.1 protein of unknown function [Maridesulfovibrio hydrothermalis AM13 = DSM 14728]